jgi:hypothetical protein
LKLFFPGITSSPEVGYNKKDPALSAVKFLFAAIPLEDFMTLTSFGRYTRISGEQ